MRRSDILWDPVQQPHLQNILNRTHYLSIMTHITYQDEDQQHHHDIIIIIIHITLRVRIQMALC